MASTPSQQTRPARPRPPPRRHSSNNGKFDSPTLGTIDEDGGMAPDIPPKAHHRQFARMFHLVPLLHFEKDPDPPIYDFENILGPNGEKLADVRRNWRTKSGGRWRRTILLTVVSLLLIAGLIVGLALGLKNRGHSNNNSTTPSSSTTFPAGSYTITTFLTAVSTSCTSNPSTWRCWPYSTYNESSSSSLTTFNWIISPTGLSAENFVISSSNNPFSLTFTNASLTIVDSGLETEAYAFMVPVMQKVVIPNTALTSDGATDTCYFNNTVFEARLYTRMAKTYNRSNGGENGGSGMTTGQGQGQGQDWPHAVSAQQKISGGDGVPDCYKAVNGANGDHVGIAAESGDGECSCVYQNFGD